MISKDFSMHIKGTAGEKGRSAYQPATSDLYEDNLILNR